MTFPIDNILSRFPDAKRNGNGWRARCPVHDGHSLTSVSISEGDNGTVLLHCFKGCSCKAIVQAIGLNESDLFPDNNSQHNKRDRGSVPMNQSKPVKAAKGKGRGYNTAQEAITATIEWTIKTESREGRNCVFSDSWDYHSINDDHVGVVLRFDLPHGDKTFRPISLVDGKWHSQGLSAEQSVYNLSAAIDVIRQGKPVYWCEGEKAVDATGELGLVAITTAGGSGAFRKADISPLRGGRFIILPDNDEPGEKYKNDVLRGLAELGGDTRVKVLNLPHVEEGDDIVDYIQGLRKEDQTDEQIRTNVDAMSDQLEWSIPADMIPEIEPECEDNQIPGIIPPFKPFPVDSLPEPSRTFVIEGAKAFGCDPSYIAAGLLPALASAIGNTHRIKLKNLWSEPSIFWTAIIGESGTMKSPALKYALQFVEKRQDKAIREYKEKLKAWEIEYTRWEAENDKWKKEARKNDKDSTDAIVDDPPTAPERPCCARTWTHDITVESMLTLLHENTRGLLSAPDELSGWFNSFGRYAQGKSSDAERYIEMYAGGKITTDRKSGGGTTEYIPRASLSITGSIQPETLRRVLTQQYRDNGLAARMLFTMPPRQPKQWTEDDVDEQTVSDMGAVFDRLYALEFATDAEGEPVPRLLTLDSDAKRAWVKFYNEHNREQLNHTGDVSAAWSKLEGYVPRFALIIHLTRVAADDPTVADSTRIDRASIEAGISLVQWFKGEVDRVYAYLSGDEQDRDCLRLMDWIRAKGGSVSVKDLYDAKRKRYPKAVDAENELKKLVGMGLGELRYDRPGEKGGRPPSPRFILNEEPDTQNAKPSLKRA